MNWFELPTAQVDFTWETHDGAVGPLPDLARHVRTPGQRFGHLLPEYVVDEGDMTERLRGVAEVGPGRGLDPPREQAERVGVVGDVLEDLEGFVQPTREHQGVDQPERTEQERPLLAWEAVTALVSLDQSLAVDEPLERRVDRPLDAVVVEREEAGDRDQEPGRVEEVVPLERADETPQRVVVAVLEERRESIRNGAGLWSGTDAAEKARAKRRELKEDVGSR